MPFGRVRTPVECRDGFKISVQASSSHYCSPRNNEGPYVQVEVGYPSAVEETLLDYMDGGTDHPTESVYGWVPVEVVAAIIERHGGIVSGDLPPFLGTFMCADLHSLSVTVTDEPVCQRFSMLEFD